MDLVLRKEVLIDSPAGLEPLAMDLVRRLRDRQLVCFYGPVGAGKTTLVQAICRRLGVDEDVTSPSYALVNTYADRQGAPIYHLDLYRLRDLNEAWQIGVEEYLYGDGLCLVEWPELIEPLLNELSVLVVKITVLDDTHRKISIFEA